MRRPDIFYLTFGQLGRRLIAVCIGSLCLSGCSTPLRKSDEQFASIGVKEGVTYWSAQEKLAREGYRCFVTGEKRENFDCTKTVGFFPTCVMRVDFKASDTNLVSDLRVADPACIGTP